MQVAALLYGLYVAAFLATLWVLPFRKHQGVMNQWLPYYSAVMFLLMTVEIICVFLQAFWTTDFTYFRGRPHNYSEPETYNRELILNDLFNILNSVATSSTIILADILLAWRAFVISGSKMWVQILAMVLILGEAVCGYGGVVLCTILYTMRSHISAGSATLGAHFTDTVQLASRFNTAFYALTLVTNIALAAFIVTIVWKAYWIGQKQFQSGHAGKQCMIWLFLMCHIESGAAYAVSTVLLTIFSTAGNGQSNGWTNLQTAILAPLSWGLSGIMPTSIIILIGLGKAWEHRQDTATMSTMQFAANSKPGNVEAQPWTSRKHTVEDGIAPVIPLDMDSASIGGSFSEEDIGRLGCHTEGGQY